jgi:tripartite-type tricarboxylate transporter receptor subunit TctC
LRLIVPFTPGTGIDLIARTVGPKLAERLGRPVVVDNRAGASGNIGTEAVVRAAPNGQTLLVSVNTLVMNRSLYPQAAVDPVKDLVPVSLTSWGQLLLVAHPGTGLPTAGNWSPRLPRRGPAASTTRRRGWAHRTTCPWSCSRPRPECSSRTSRTGGPARR